jgi:hypothetical protein
MKMLPLSVICPDRATSRIPSGNQVLLPDHVSVGSQGHHNIDAGYSGNFLPELITAFSMPAGSGFCRGSGILPGAIRASD